MIPTTRIAACLLVCGTLVGCGKPTSSVSGHVTYDGSAVKGGEVYFFDADGDKETVKTPIKPDGSYSLSNVLAGKKRVAAVAPRELVFRGGDSKDEEPPAPELDYPDDAVGQNTDFDLQPGANVFNLELKKPAHN